MFSACSNYFEKAVLAVLVSRKVGVIFPPTLTTSVSCSSAVVRYCDGSCRPFSQYRHNNNRENNWKKDNSDRNNNEITTLKHSRQSPPLNFGGRGRQKEGQQRANNFSTAMTTTTGERRGRQGRGRAGERNNFSNSRRIAGVNDNRGKSQMEEEEERFQMSLEEYKKEFRQQIQEYGDPLDEPDDQVFSKTYRDYIRETEELKDRIKTKRLSKKHYAHMNPNYPYNNEIGLLTWAEKENIRYLNETDPWQWTPEAIAEAFPISAEGVDKLLRGTMRLRLARDVVNHDTRVAERIRDLKSGKLPMTEDLERRLKIRDLIPLKVGDLGMNPDSYFNTNLPKKLGEFAKLVAPPERPSTSKIENKKKVVVSQRFSEESKGGEGDAKAPPPLKPELTKKELKKILPRGKLMTFSEFEGRMRKKKAGEKAGDMKYMLEDLKHISTPPPTSNSQHGDDDEEIELQSEKQSDSKFPSNVPKYRKPEETKQPVDVKVEGDRAYVYQADTGYQRPYVDGDDSPDSITIPEELRGKPGATYKVGDSYYDENGEFLYRAI